MNENKIIFVEFKNEIDILLKYVRGSKSKSSCIKIVALSLEAQIYLKELNVDFYNTLPFFTNESHENCLLKSDSIVQFMEDSIYFENNPEDINGYKDFYIFNIRHVVNYILWLIEVITNAIEYLRPDTILTFKFVNNSYYNALINNNERYSGEMCKLICEKYVISTTELNIDLKNVKMGVPITKTSELKKRTKNINEKIGRFANINTIMCISIGYNLENVFKKIKKINKNAKVIYVHNEHQSIVHKLYFKYFKNIDEFLSFDEIENYVIYSDIENDLIDCFDLLENHNELFEYKDINFWETIGNKISKGINTEVKSLARNSNKLSHLIERLEPNLTLSYYSRNLAYNLGEICRNNGLEALCISHGTVTPPKNNIEEIVNRNIGKSVILNRYPTVAVQTPWCEKFLDYYEHESKDIKTGPLIFRNNIKRTKTKKQKIIVHSVTLKARSSFKFYGVETHDEFVSSISSLIKAVEKIENTKLIIRLHPIYKSILSKNKFKHILPQSDCYSFSCGGSIYDVLKNADLLVSYSSTTIEEALLNKIPVLLYDKWNRYEHFDAVELECDRFKPYPVYYANNKSTMNENLPLILKNGLTDKIKDEDWSNYSYPKDVEFNFYEYVHDCLNK